MSDGGFDFGGITDSFSDFFSDALPVDSFTDSFGTEFLSDFNVPGVDVTALSSDMFGSEVISGSLYEQVGSFAGDASWFDTNYFGSIIDQAGAGISDFGSTISESFSSIQQSVGDGLGYLQDKASDFLGINPGGLLVDDQGVPLLKASVGDVLTNNIKNLAGSALDYGTKFAVQTGTQLATQAVSQVVGGAVSSVLPAPLAAVVTKGVTQSVGSLAGLNTATPGFVGPTKNSPSFIDSTISSLSTATSQVFNGVVNTGTRAVNATLSGLVGSAVASTGLPKSLTTGITTGYNTGATVIPTALKTAASAVSNAINPQTGTAFVGTTTGLNVLPGEIPVEREGDELIDLNTGEVVGIETGGFTQTDGGLNVLPGEIPVEREGNELIDLNTGEVVGIDADGFTQTDGGLNVLPEEIPVEREGNELVNLNTGETYEIDDDGFVVTDGGLRVLPEEVDGDPNALVPEEGGLIEFTDQGPVVRSAADVQALRDQAQAQQTVREQRQNKAQSGDWRVRLRLAPTSTYLYNAADCGPVLQPLRVTDGVIFPYTPSIDMAYKANYSQYDLTHSNYRGYFYQNSAIDAINLKATFTAQDTVEANYLLAVIHFFRSATKMFYGQDAERGSPPPLTYLSGFGDYQFNEHPCLISQFNYSLPADVDYIRAQTASVNGQNLLQQRNRQTIAGNPLSYAINRLASVGLTKGALDDRFAAPTLGIANPTYVPTKMEIQLTLLPTQSRQQVSKQFSVKNFANGNLLKGGFW